MGIRARRRSMRGHGFEAFGGRQCCVLLNVCRRYLTRSESAPRSHRRSSISSGGARCSYAHLLLICSALLSLSRTMKAHRISPSSPIRKLGTNLPLASPKGISRDPTEPGSPLICSGAWRFTLTPIPDPAFGSVF